MFLTQSHRFTELPELRVSLVFKAEPEGSLSYILVQDLKGLVVAYKIKDVAKGLPEETQPRCQHYPVGSRLCVLTADSTKEETVCEERQWKRGLEQR